MPDLETVEQMLARLTNPDGSQRFYPPGEHPATYRDRWMVSRLKEIRAVMVADPFAPGPDREALATLDESIARHERRCEEFEAAQNQAKGEVVRAWVKEYGGG
jgi:hypothetical protein